MVAVENMLVVVTIVVVVPVEVAATELLVVELITVEEIAQLNILVVAVDGTAKYKTQKWHVRACYS